MFINFLTKDGQRNKHTVISTPNFFKMYSTLKFHRILDLPNILLFRYSEMFFSILLISCVMVRDSLV